MLEFLCAKRITFFFLAFVDKLFTNVVVFFVLFQVSGLLQVCMLCAKREYIKIVKAKYIGLMS